MRECARGMEGKVLEGGEKFSASCDHVTDASNIQLSTNSHTTVYLLTTPVTNSHPVTILHSQIRVCISLLVVVWMSRRCKFRGECGRKPNIYISMCVSHSSIRDERLQFSGKSFFRGVGWAVKSHQFPDRAADSCSSARQRGDD